MSIAGVRLMKVLVALAVVALLAVLLGSAWMRRGEWDLTGESGTMLVGLAVSLAAVLIILAALGGVLS